MNGGRLDKNATGNPTEAEALARADLREAYERGRRDERAARRRHPVLMTLTFAFALIGVVLLALAAANGSFMRAGGLVDEKLNVAADRAGPAVGEAATNAGQAVRDAGGQVRTRADNAG